MTGVNLFAFPVTPEVWASHTDFHGMTLRDWFAGQALAGLFANSNSDMTQEHAAKVVYGMADAMLAAREKGRA